jgi:polysaccharide biosynthesis/export protein
MVRRERAVMSTSGDVLAPFARRAVRVGNGSNLVGARKILEKARIFAICLAFGAAAASAYAEPQNAGTAPAASNTAARPAGAPALPAGVSPPSGYLIGPDDQLSIVYWREKDLSADVVVRPDGLISLPLLNDVQASGLTPEQLRAAITEGATKFVEEPTVSVVVKAINSRKVFITGQVAKPGNYPIGGPTTVLQLIATAGGIGEYADKGKVSIVRRENGKDHSFRFNYEDVMKGKNLSQNIELKPGDTVIVP